jgi:hypothetical protein
MSVGERQRALQPALHVIRSIVHLNLDCRVDLVEAHVAVNHRQEVLAGGVS